MTFPLYKDIGKNANDLTSKGFASSDRFQWKFEADIMSDNVQHLPSLSLTDNGAFDGELKRKFKAFNASFTAAATLKKAVSLEAALDKPYNGVCKPTLSISTFAEDDALKRIKLKVATESRSSNFNLTTSVDVPVARFLNEVNFKTDLPKITLSAVAGSSNYGVMVGGEMEFIPEKAQTTALNLVLAHSRLNSESTIFRKQRANFVTYGANFYSRYPSTVFSNCFVGGELSHDFSDKPPLLTLAGSYKPDLTSSLKARVDSKGILGFAWTQQFGGPFTTTVCADMDVTRQTESAQWSLKIAAR